MFPSDLPCGVSLLCNRVFPFKAVLSTTTSLPTRMSLINGCKGSMKSTLSMGSPIHIRLKRLMGSFLIQSRPITRSRRRWCVLPSPSTRIWIMKGSWRKGRLINCPGVTIVERIWTATMSCSGTKTWTTINVSSVGRRTLSISISTIPMTSKG